MFNVMGMMALSPSWPAVLKWTGWSADWAKGEGTVSVSEENGHNQLTTWRGICLVVEHFAYGNSWSSLEAAWPYWGFSINFDHWAKKSAVSSYSSNWQVLCAHFSLMSRTVAFLHGAHSNICSTQIMMFYFLLNLIKTPLLGFLLA